VARGASAPLAEPVLRDVRAGVLLRVRVTPRASVNAVEARRNGALVIRVTAAPADGQANPAVCRTVARTLGIGRSYVTVERGERARTKLLLIAGMSAAQVTERIIEQA